MPLLIVSFFVCLFVWLVGCLSVMSVMPVMSVVSVMSVSLSVCLSGWLSVCFARFNPTICVRFALSRLPRAQVSSFAAQKPVVMADYPIENDGHRSPEDMDRLIAAIADASMSDDKVRPHTPPHWRSLPLSAFPLPPI